MGKSRSATCVIAYLMQKYNINTSEALAYVRRARSIVEPNPGFMEQLDLYGQMHTPPNVEDTPAYQRWVYQREIELSRACGQAPEPDKIRFEDEHVTDEAANFELRCRKCRQVLPFPGYTGPRSHLCRPDLPQRLHTYRRPLATSQYLVPHRTVLVSNAHNENSPSRPPSPTCAHYFLDPLSWMRPELEQGKLDGRLECPKCHTNVGKYAWQGMQCSCSEWIVPGISISKSRVDQVKKNAVSDIRRPPGMAAPPSTNASHAKQNL